MLPLTMLAFAVLQFTMLAFAVLQFTMLPFVTLALLGGILLGQRFKILALVIASCLDLVLTIGAEASRGEWAWSIGLSALVAVSGLQLGYLLGLTLRWRRISFLTADVHVPRRSFARGFTR